MIRGSGAAALLAFAALAASGQTHADVRIIRGATPIPHGDARSPGDITVVNEKLAFALAVESPVPFGVPRGAIIDVAPVVDGKIGRDRVVFADFIPNNWSAWPNTQRNVEVIEQGPERVILRATRDWGRATITTVYTLGRNADAVEIQSTLTNHGDSTLSALLSGMTLWPNSGFLFGVPGLSGKAAEAADGALTDRVVAYDENWAVTLHAPYFDHVGYGSKDMFRLHTLAPGESRRFDAELQVGASGDLAPVLRDEIRRKHLHSGVVRGRVTTQDGKAVPNPVVVIEKQGQPFAWTLGRAGAYDVRLPTGAYSVYATARNHSQSAPAALTVVADSRQTLDFRGLKPPGQIHFAVTNRANGRALDARLVIHEGQRPLVGFLGKKAFFTTLAQPGVADIAIAPGRYVFTVTSGGGFTSPSKDAPLTVSSGQTVMAKIALSVPFDPASHGWYCADLHHHADQAEAVTPPADVARSQLAAGLDVLFISDHDSTFNQHEMQGIADRRGVAFMPGIELSPSWGHFNVYPVSPRRKLAIDTSTADVNAVFEEARRLGAIAVQANHPFIPFGYLTSVAAGVAPGGFNPAFDLLEINAAETGDDQVLSALRVFWNAGHRYYLTAGTDTHDVWKDESGRVRVYAHVDGPVTANAFARSLKDGHAYVSYGPLIYPSVMLGDTLRLKPDQSFSLAFDLKSIAGLARADLVGGDGVAASHAFEGSPREAHIDFPLKAQGSRWYALVVVDKSGKRAFTNPVWIDTVRF